MDWIIGFVFFFFPNLTLSWFIRIWLRIEIGLSHQFKLKTDISIYIYDVIQNLTTLPIMDYDVNHAIFMNF